MVRNVPEKLFAGVLEVFYYVRYDMRAGREALEKISVVRLTYWEQQSFKFNRLLKPSVLL